jgi:hypothetical protein
MWREIDVPDTNDTICCLKDHVEYYLEPINLPDGFLDYLFERLEEALAVDDDDDGGDDAVLAGGGDDEDDDTVSDDATAADDNDTIGAAAAAADDDNDETTNDDRGGELEPSPVEHTMHGRGSMYISDLRYPTHVAVRRSCRVAERQLYREGMYKC